jgi:predicted esterase
MTMSNKKSILLRLLYSFLRICFSSLPSWVLLGVILIALPFFISQPAIDQLRAALTRNAWLTTAPFFPDWFAFPIWITLFWLALNIALWLLKHYLHTIKIIARIPYLSIPFLILTATAITIYHGYNSTYLKQLYSPRESYIRTPAHMKSLREKLINNNPHYKEYEQAAQKKPVRSRTKGRLWDIPEAVHSRFTPLTYNYTGGRYKNTTIKYRLHIPDNLEPNKKYPLLLWLHGVGESGNDNISQLAHMEPLIPFISGKNQRQLFILATQCPNDNKMWDVSKSKEKNAPKGDAPMTIAMEVLDDVIKNYPIDENAISVFGISSGGYGVMSIARKYHNRFAALIPTACNPHRNLYKDTIEYNTALWMFNNIGDKDIVGKRIEEEVKLIHDNGGNAYMTNFETKGHDSWRYAILETPLIDWLLWYKRNPSPYQPPYNINPPNRTNSFFKLFVLPIHIGGIVLVLPLLIVSLETVAKLARRKPNTKHESEPKPDNENKIIETQNQITTESEIPIFETTADGFKIWTDTTGNEKNELLLICFAGTHATFATRKGKLFTAELDYFCEEDKKILHYLLNSAY